MEPTTDQLLELAKQIVALNPDINIGVTGSLMLSMRGVYLGRDPKDIDFVCSHIKSDDGTKFDGLNLPEGSEKRRPSYPDSASYTIPLPDGSGDVQVDFLVSIEQIEVVDNMPLGEVKKLLEAKVSYMMNDQSQDSRAKHSMDIEIMCQECDPDGSLGYENLVATLKSKKKDPLNFGD